VNEVYKKAVDFLVRREYSAYELQQKLILAGFDELDIENVLNQLINEGLQSDKRFAEMFVRTRVNQGKGPLLIKQQLKQKGINEFDFSDYDFYELIRNVWQKKYNNQPTNAKEKAQQIRFLQSRGFNFDEINTLF